MYKLNRVQAGLLRSFYEEAKRTGIEIVHGRGYSPSPEETREYKQFMKQHTEFLRASAKSTLNVGLEILSEPELLAI